MSDDEKDEKPMDEAPFARPLRRTKQKRDRCEASAAGVQCRRDEGHDGQHSATREDERIVWD